MALTVTTDLTVISTAETLTGWSNYGSGGAGASALEPDYFIQGANCISRGVTGAATNKGMCFDIGAGNVLNFSTTHAGKLIFIWIRSSTAGACDTRVNGGIRVVLGSGATAPGDAAGVWSAWYVDGGDTLAATDGWKCYVIDPRTTPSTTFGGGVDLTAVRWFGGVMRSTATLKGQNFGVDQVSYGFGTLRVSGTNTLDGRGFGEVADADYGTTANKYGVIPVVKDGVIFCQGRIQLGDSSGTAALTFTSQDETVVWSHPVYYDGTRVVPCVPNARPDGTPYFGVKVVGNGTGNTSVTIGAKVGSGDTAVGRSGTSFTGSRTRTSCTFDDGAVETVLVYGSTFAEMRGGLDFSGNASSDEFIGNNVVRCGSTLTGPVVMRANNFIDCYGGAYTGGLEDFRNDGAAAQQLATADPSFIWDDTLNGSNWSVPVGVPYVELLDPGGSDRREVTKITADIVGNNDHYAEAIVRWPAAGANQSALGVCIRMATGATENYYYLKCDLRNSQVTLIRCDAGTDTTIDGPDAFTFAEDTDYLVHLIADGNDIEGFVSGGGATVEMFAASQSSYNTNRRVGIRGDAEADQTGTAPRLSRFGCGPETDALGALYYAAAGTADVKKCRLINSARGICIPNTGTYSFDGFLVSGNAVGTRNQSGGAVTVNASSGDSPSVVENKGSATTTINNTVSYTLTNLVSGSEVRIFKVSDGSELAGTESSGTSFNYDYTYVSDVDVYVIIQKTNYEWLRINDTLVSTSKSQKVLQRTDLNYVNP